MKNTELPYLKGQILTEKKKVKYIWHGRAGSLLNTYGWKVNHMDTTAVSYHTRLKTTPV